MGISAMRGSQKDQVKSFFRDAQEPSRSVGEIFCKQLDQLAAKLSEGGTLFVRCIKPNIQMVPGVVDRRLTLEQLVNGGVVSALEMRRRGFADRMAYQEFYDEFSLLHPGWNRNVQDEEKRKKCETILGWFAWNPCEDVTNYAFGTSRVFMKVGVLSTLR